jgi:hypothetical protein
VWYACVDLAVLTAACFLGAVSALGSPGACRGSAIAVLLLYGGLLVLCAATRPFTTLFSHVHALTSLVLSTTAVACQVWYLYGVADVDAALEALRQLLTAAAVCDLLVAGISLAKTVVDAADALRACRGHVIAVLHAALRRDAGRTVYPAIGTLHAALDTGNDVVDGCQPDGIAALLAVEEVAPPMFDDDAFLFLAVDEEGQLPGTDSGGIATAWEATVRDGSDLMRLYSQAHDDVCSFVPLAGEWSTGELELDDINSGLESV